MNVRCPQCNQAYHIPEEKIDTKKMYFMCEACSHKIVVQPRMRDRWYSFKPLSFKNLNAWDILEGIYLGFNKKNILISFFTLVFSILLSALAGVIIYNSLDMFIRNPAMGVGFVFFFLIIIYYIYDLHLYLISKNIFSNIRGGGNTDFSQNSLEVRRNSFYVFLFSGGLLFILGAMLLPFYVLNIQFGFIYTGILYVPMLILCWMLFLLLVLKNVIYALMASGNRKLKELLRTLWQLIMSEHLALPVYSIIIWIISFIGFVLLQLAFIAGTVLIGFSTASMMVTDSTPLLKKLMESGFSVETISSLNIGEVRPLWAGLMLMVVAIGIIQCFIGAFFINWRQGLTCASLVIMERNPGRSMPRGTLIAAIGIIFLFLLFLVFQMVT